MFNYLKGIKEVQKEAMENLSKVIPDLNKDQQKFFKKHSESVQRAVVENDLDELTRLQKDLFKFIETQKA